MVPIRAPLSSAARLVNWLIQFCSLPSLSGNPFFKLGRYATAIVDESELTEMLAPNQSFSTTSKLTQTDGGEVRTLQSGDIASVAELFQMTFRSPRRRAPTSLADYLRSLFLHHPWQCDDIRSLVFIDNAGELKGFIGVLPVQLHHHGKSLRAAVMGSLMAKNPEENPLVGARLVRAALRGGQDISLSESANPLSQRMWELAGGRTLPLFSMTWLRIFRPIAVPIAFLAAGPRLQRICTSLVSPLDAVLSRFDSNPFSRPLSAAADCDVPSSIDEFIGAVPALVSHYAVRPDWDPATLRWQLLNASTKEKFGDLKCRFVRKGNRTVGGFLYYSRPGGIGFVLQIFAEPEHEFAVVASLLARAASDGCVAMRGRTQPELLDPLIRSKALLFQRSSTVVHAKDRDLTQSLRLGDALITGLAAETWTRLIGGEFV